jgi:hypothetical protein
MGDEGQPGFRVESFHAQHISMVANARGAAWDASDPGVHG